MSSLNNAITRIRLFAKKVFPLLLFGISARMDHGGWSSIGSMAIFIVAYMMLEHWFFDPVKIIIMNENESG